MRSIAKLLIIFNISLSLTAEAHDCFSKNPRLLPAANIYQQLDIKPLDKQQLNQIQKILRYLTSRWFEGSASRVVCRGQIPNIKVERQRFTVRSHARSYLPDHFLLELHLEDMQNLTSMIEHLRFYIRENALRFTFESARGNIELIRLSHDLLEFASQHRHLGSITETHWLIKMQHHQLSIEKRIYGQGVLGEYIVWNLHRR